MTGAVTPPEHGDQLREEAAAWFAKMRGDDAGEHQAAFDAWLSRGAAHRAAYNRIGEMFAEAKILKDREDVVPRANVQPRRRPVPIVTAVVAGAVAIGSVVALTGRHDSAAQIARSGNPPATSHFVHSLALAAGSRAILDAGAIVAPGGAGDPAVARLETGRARFVLADAPVPARVVAGSLQIQSNGGTFDVTLLQDGSVDTHVINGEAQFLPATWHSGDGRLRFAHLVAGQRSVIDPAGRIIRRLPPEGTEWPHGILEYRGTPLRDVIIEANRYSPVKIVLADPTLEGCRVSGRFRVNDPTILAQRLAAALSLELNRSQSGSLILYRKK